MDELYNDLLALAEELDLINVKKALPFVKRELKVLAETYPMTSEYSVHGTIIARILSDLHLPLEASDMDLIISSALCHILCEINPSYDLKRNLAGAGIDDSVTNFVGLMVAADKEENHVDVTEDRLLFMVKLVERANLIEHLCDMSTEESKAFIHETKRKLLPMCICGKEKYPEFSTQINVLMEKMRTLIQVMDILYARYDSEQEELYDEILSYRDENYRIRKLLGELKNF